MQQACAPLLLHQQQGKLSNGLRVVLLEDHEVPLVRGTILMKGGQQSSPADKVGLASISLAMQRSGGSTSTPGPELDAALESVAASIECRAGKQVCSSLAHVAHMLPTAGGPITADPSVCTGIQCQFQCRI
jgi:predicted Zn-dependent peptidase